MMLNIAICDDEPIHVDLIKNYINSSNVPYKVNCILTYSGEKLLESLKDNSVDAIFLDIEMEGMDGIQAGRKIREKDKDVIIVYLTGYKDYALEAFEIESFNYLIKPVTKERFMEEMNRIFLRIQEKKALKEKEKLFHVYTKGKLIKLKYNDIYFFEKFFRKIKVYTLDETIEFYGSMKDLLGDLDNSYFIRCHQSYVVNKSKIREIQENKVILDGKTDWCIPISRTYKKSIKDVFYENLFSS